MRRELTDRPSITLPLCVLGAGIVHGICIAALLPMLITVPAPVKSNAGPHIIDIEVKQAEAARPDAPAVEQAPALVTGSLAAPAAARANLIAALPREDLHAAEPVLVTLAGPAAADIVLANADPAVAGAIPAALEEIEAAGPPIHSIEATEAEAEKPAAMARAEPAPPPSQSLQRKTSAPPQKAREIQAKPRARARGTTAAPTPRRQASIPATPSAGLLARRPAQTRLRTAPNLGLGLFLPGPQPARRQAVGR
jgi:hypothetical protein